MGIEVYAMAPEQWNMASKRRMRKICGDYEAASGVGLTGFQFGLHTSLVYGLVQIIQHFCIGFIIFKMGILSHGVEMKLKCFNTYIALRTEPCS